MGQSTVLKLNSQMGTDDTFLCTWMARDWQAYDFGGQDVYYAMHHLFLSETWLPEKCGRLQ